MASTSPSRRTIGETAPPRAALPRLAAVAAIGGEVLGHEDDLVHPTVGPPVALHEVGHLSDDVLGAARALGATKRRDGTESAAAVAPLGDLDVGPGSLRRAAGKLQEVEGRRRRRDHRLPRLPPRQADRDGRGRWLLGHDRLAEPGDQVDLGEGPGELGAVALGEAAGHDQPGARPAGRCRLEDCLDGFLARRLDEGTGVDDHQVGVLGRGRPAVAAPFEPVSQLVAVHQVLGTPESLQPVPVQLHSSRGRGLPDHRGTTAPPPGRRWSMPIA